MRETRTGQLTELRTDATDGRHYFTARICNYNVPDSYKTSWAPGVFNRSLDRELPTAVFAHQWDRPIGKVVSYQDNPDGLDVTVRMSDLSVNPDAMRMYHHLKDGEINQFSFAFERVSEERDAQHDGVTLIKEATMDEVSPVLRGSVPGTRVLSMRSGESIDKQTAADLLVKFSSGQIDLAEALTALKTLEATDPGNPGTGEGPSKDAENPTPFNTPMPNEPSPTVEPEDEPQPDEDEKDILSKLDILARGR
jgi:HK97 family phage prohead protease